MVVEHHQLDGLIQVVKLRVGRPHRERACAAVERIHQKGRVHFIELKTRGMLQPFLQAIPEGFGADHLLRRVAWRQCIQEIIHHHAVGDGRSLEPERILRENIHHVIAGAAKADDADLLRIRQPVGDKLLCG